MNFLRNWLLGVTAAAMLIAMAGAMIPEGPIRKVGRFTGGLLLLIAILQPVTGLDYTSLARGLSLARGDLADYAAQPTTENFHLMKSIIQARCGAYIQDKAAEMDIVCQAEVLCTADTEEEYPYPAAVRIQGSLTLAQQERLTRLIEADLAIPAESQTYFQGTSTTGQTPQQEGGETP